MSEEIDGWHIREIDGEERKWAKEDREQAIEDYNEFAGEDFVGTIEVVDPEGRVVKSMDEQTDTDGLQERVDAEVIDMTTKENKPDTSETEASESEPTRGNKGKTQLEPASGFETDIDALAKNPIEWLRGKNDEYVNVIKGTPAISKRGFRYIQSQFGISTESEIIEILDEPLGAIVWAKAELPDGRKAEAHGEGYQFESGLDDNEWVRYADTRAKNRALADLTSSGALATEEMKGK